MKEISTREISRPQSGFRVERKHLLWALGLMTGLSLIALPKYLRAKRSEHWPTTEGVITSSWLRPGYGKRQAYVAQVEFRYRVGNIEYWSTTRSFGYEHYARPSAWQPVVDKYPKGKAVRVYYEPGNPALGILEPGRDDEMELLYKLDLILIWGFGLGVVVTLLWYRDPEDVTVLTRKI
jgi:hypothetical protein